MFVNFFFKYLRTFFFKHCFHHKARSFVFQRRTVPFKSSHEGINYAEMNLTDRQPPPIPAAVTILQSPQTSDAYQFRQTSQLASTISVNSVV